MLFLSLKMNFNFSAEVWELLTHFAVFFLPVSFFEVWTRNVFALNYLPGAQYHKAHWQTGLFFCFSPSLPSILVVSSYVGE